VIGGRNDGPIDIEQFLPSDVHIRVGDTIEWTSAGYEGHTITFSPYDYLAALGDYLVPDPDDPEQVIFNDKVALRSGTGDSYPGDGGAYNSGFIGVPVEGTYKLTFTEEGICEYLCVVHPLWMRGVVSVDEASAQVTSPESVAARGKAEYAALVEDAKGLLARAQDVQRSAPAPGGATLHRVQVGLTTMYGQIAVFTDNSLEIESGDTVIFENDDRNFHNVVFKGDRAEFPSAYEIRVDPGGRGFNVALEKESALATGPPPDGFDASTFMSSGTMGVLQPRQTWRLTFDAPGTYVYQCTIHQFAGMAGAITVR
jgi:plastocyanin